MPASCDPRTASAVTRAFFQALEHSNIPAQEVARKGGIHINSLYCWKAGKASASVLNMEAVLAVLGLELAIRPINSSQESTP